MPLRDKAKENGDRREGTIKAERALENKYMIAEI